MAQPIDRPLNLPLNLFWGQSRSDVERQLTLFGCEYIQGLERCRIKNPDEHFFLIASSSLYFAPDENGLVFVQINSKSTYNDFYGYMGVSIYRHLKGWSGVSELSGDTYEFTSKHYKDNYEHFYECLNQLGCANYSTFGKSSDGSIAMVKLVAADRIGGSITIKYQSPRFTDYKFKDLSIHNDT